MDENQPKPRPRRLSSNPLLTDENQAEQGLVNPAVEMDGETAYQAFSQGEGESSAAEIEEIGQAKSLVKDLKTRRRQRQKELSKLTTPKDDVSGELKTVKKKSKLKVEETTKEELAKVLADAKAASEAEDGTITLPAETEDGLVSMLTETEDGTVRMRETFATEEGIREATPTLEESTAVLPPEEKPKEEDKEEPPETPSAPARGMSLRARMRSRVQKAKELAESEIREQDREERKRLKDIRQQKSMTRFDTEISEVDIEKLAEERRKKVKQRWLKMGMTDMKESGLPSMETAYDFFTRHWDSEEETDKSEVEIPEGEKPEGEKPEGEKPEGDKPEGEKPEGETEEGEKPEEETEPKTQDTVEEDEETTDDSKPLLGDKDDDVGYGMTVLKKPEIIDPIKQREMEDKLLFVPSVNAVPASEKIIGDIQPRYLEEEGFYVGVRPEIPVRNQNKMEQRLIHQPNNKGRKWFGEDGNVIALPDPLRPSPSRPVVSEEPDPYLETVFRKAVVHEFDQRYIDGTIEGGGQYQLDVDINSLAFSHHHLFSREHVLAEKLSDLYRQYYIRKKKNMTEFLREKLQALKGSKLHLEEHISNNKREMSACDRKNYEKRLMDYKYEIKQTRMMRDREEEVDRTLLKNNIHTWKELKLQREEQIFTNTAVKLNIRSEDTNKSDDQLWWKKEIEEELEELREEHEEEYKRRMAIYHEQMQAVENQKHAKENAQKALKKGRKGSRSSQSSRLSKASKLSAELTEDDRKELQDILDALDLPEPELPENFDENKMREQLKNKALKIRRRPGEPILNPELTNTAVVTPTNQCPRPEQQRRDDVSHTKLFVRVFFNHKQVCQTTSKPLAQDFTVNFGYIYNLKIIQWPESIKFEVHESRGLSSTLLTELYAGIPEASITAQNVQLDDFEFSSEHRVHFTHEAVGSGVPFTFKSTQSPIVILMTTGTMRCSVAWGIDENGLPLIPPSTNLTTNNIFNAMKLMDPVSAIGTSGVMNLEKLSKWFEQARLDPNDPANADFVYLLGTKGGESQLENRDFFRLDQLLEEFNMATDEELRDNKRFRLLQMRDLEVPEFQNMKTIPPFEKEIPRDAFVEYDKRLREREMKKSDDIEVYHATAKKNMQKVRDKVMQYLRQEAHQKVFQDVVKEDKLPPFIDIISGMLHMAEPKRPLKPVRQKHDPRPITRGPHDPPPYILINVIRAFDIPMRKSATSEGTGHVSRREIMSNIVGNTLVRPFVEAIFQESNFQTSTVDGPNPSFNEELRLPLEAPDNDYSCKSLQRISDCVYLNLFDEVIHDILENDQQRKSNVHQRIERKWLGTLQIPFSTIYLNVKIDGTFRINKPPILLGYENKEDTTDTYLQLFATTQPSLKIPEPVKYKFPSNEKEKLLQRAERWQIELEIMYPRRQYVTTVVDMNCKTVFVTRYLKALKPPEGILGGDNTEELVAWYVSMIPFVADAFIFPGMSDIWSTCDQFIQLLAGDEEEHAVLLANYFMTMGKTTWLVTGTAIPEGPTAYVMTKDDDDYTIWNAGTAEHYNYKESWCPLISIGCLINSENIWANINEAERPSKLDFDLTKTANWKPFFNSSYPYPGLSSIQPEALIYDPVDENAVLLLKETIEQALKNKIMDWRSHYITRWNRHCTQIMRKILPSLEESCGKSANPAHLQELENSFSQYKVSGFPLHMAFSTLENVVEQIHATGVHAQDTSDIEFALAVYVKAYPSSILSVWVYVASLIRNR